MRSKEVCCVTGARCFGDSPGRGTKTRKDGEDGEGEVIKPVRGEVSKEVAALDQKGMKERKKETSDGLQLNSDGLQPLAIAMASNLLAMASNLLKKE